MSLNICSLASGSSGNCYMVAAGETALLVDAGISGRQIRERLAFLGRGCEEIAAVLVTHEHSDHVKGLPALIRMQKKICASRLTLEALGLSEDAGICGFEPGETFDIGDIRVESFRISHDAADPVGYSFSADGKCICIISDTGCVGEEIKGFIRKSDILVLEANHDENVLKLGPYPWWLKQRILGEKGHLSNTAAAEALSEVISSEESRKRRIVLLAHLSRENNFPEMAKTTVENILREKGCKPNACILSVLSRNEVSKIYE